MLKRTGTGTATVEQKKNYYPFGLRYLEYVRTGSPENHYLYNDKEWQSSIRQLDYGARLYDPVIGRWNVVDPLAEAFDNLSLFAYGLSQVECITSNNPV